MKRIEEASQDLRLVTMAEVIQMVPYTPQHIRRLEKDKKFPQGFKLGKGRKVWFRAHVEKWLLDCMEGTDNA